jgi:hypothetical protein
VPVILVALFIVVLSSAGLQRLAELRGRQVHADVAAFALNLRVYANAVRRHADTHADASGPMEPRELDLPTWYVPRSAIHGRIENGRSFAFAVHDGSVAIGPLLAHLAPTCAHCGMKVGSRIITAAGTVLPLAVPETIPDGSLVLAL